MVEAIVAGASGCDGHGAGVSGCGDHGCDGHGCGDAGVGGSLGAHISSDEAIPAAAGCTKCLICCCCNLLTSSAVFRCYSACCFINSACWAICCCNSCNKASFCAPSPLRPPLLLRPPRPPRVCKACRRSRTPSLSCDSSRAVEILPVACWERVSRVYSTGTFCVALRARCCLQEGT